MNDSGGAYITGSTNSTKGFPILHAFQSTFSGGIRDAFVMYLSWSGELQFSTYLGGSDRDVGKGIVVGPFNVHLYITGETSSSNFPVKNAYQEKKNGNSDAFVVGFRHLVRSKGGPDFFYGTFLGGNSYESASDITVNKNKQLYITGDTSSHNFPTQNAYQSSFGGGTGDAFVSKLEPYLSPKNQLLYSTYLGGNKGEIGTSIAIDSGNQAYITGYTNSTTFPTR